MEGGELSFPGYRRFPRFPDPPYFRRSGKLDSREGRGEGCDRIVTATCRNGCIYGSHKKTFVLFNVQTSFFRLFLWIHRNSLVIYPGLMEKNAMES